MGWVRGEAWSGDTSARAHTSCTLAPTHSPPHHMHQTEKDPHINTHTSQATPSFITALPPLHKLPVPSSVPRNHLPNIRILKNMARF